jgi:hypothetical protein
VKTQLLADACFWLSGVLFALGYLRFLAAEHKPDCKDASQNESGSQSSGKPKCDPVKHPIGCASLPSRSLTPRVRDYVGEGGAAFIDRTEDSRASGAAVQLIADLLGSAYQTTLVRGMVQKAFNTYAKEQNKEQAKQIEKLKANAKHSEIVVASGKLDSLHAASLRTQNERLVKALEDIKEYCLTTGAPIKNILGHIVRLCIDAGIKKSYLEIQKDKEAKTLLAEVKPCPTTG